MGLICILVLAIALAVMFSKKIEETLAPAFLIIMGVMYVPALWIKLTGGYILALIICGASLLFVIYRYVTGHIRLKDHLFTQGGLALLIYIVFFAYYSFHRDFSHPDELYCWGLMAKNMYYYDTLFSPLSTALSSDQPPILPLLNVFFARSVGSFSDSTCYFIQNMFTISLFIPVFAKERAKFEPARFFIILLMLPSFLVLSGLEAFWLILGDMVLAALVCYCLICTVRLAQTQEKFYLGAMILALMSMCLTKRLGPVFASMCVFIAVPVLIRRSATYIRELAIMMAAIAIATFSWFGINVYDVVPFAALAGGLILYYILTVIRDVDERYKNVLITGSVLVVAGAVFGYMILILGKDSYSYAVMARFMEDLFGIGTEEGFISLSYGFYMIIAFTMAAVIRYAGAKGHIMEKDSRVDISDMFMWLGFAMIVYALFMLTMHIWQIGPMNNNLEGIIPRYLIPWEIPVVFLIFYTLFVMRDDAGLISLVIAFTVLLCISDSRELYRQLFAKHQCVGYNALSDAGIELTSDDMVYFIDEDNYFTYSDREFFYRMWPAKTNFIDQIFMGNAGRVEFSAGELEQMVASDQYLGIPYNYLYLQTIDDDFADRYGELFEDPADIAEGHAYYVILNGNGARFRLIADQ